MESYFLSRAKHQKKDTENISVSRHYIHWNYLLNRKRRFRSFHAASGKWKEVAKGLQEVIGAL